MSCFRSFLLLLFFMMTLHARADKVLIQIDSKERPAKDLIFQGQPLLPDEALALKVKGGLDLSRIDPKENPLLWTPNKLPLTTSKTFPAQDTELTLDWLPLKKDPDQFQFGVIQGGEHFRAVISLGMHAAMMRAALLRRLGYPVLLPQYYEKIKLRFRSKEEKDSFFFKLEGGTLAKSGRWIEKTDDELVVIVRDFVLESGNLTAPNYHWGHILSDNIDDFRATRALLIPFVFTDVYESINQFSPIMVEENGGYLVFNHGRAAAFRNQSTYDDLKWIVRKLSKLTRKDFKEIVESANYPEEIAKIVLELLIERRNKLMMYFHLKEDPIPADIELTVGQDVVSGKVKKAHYHGHAEEFSKQDPEAPLRASELWRYAEMEVYSGVIAEIFDRIDEELVSVTASDALQRHQNDQYTDFINHLLENPGEPYEEPVKGWAELTGGLSVRANRNLVAGTYYGLDSQVQLVDNLSVRATIGLFGGIDGLNETPFLSANVGIQRNFLHVRPLPDIKTATEADWKTLWIPGFMKGMRGYLLEEGKTEEERFEEFKKQLKVDEMLVITDTVLGDAKASIRVPVTSFLGMDPTQTMNSMSLSTGYEGMLVLRKTILTKRSDGVIQVYLQTSDASATDVRFDFNWWMSIFSKSSKGKTSSAKAKVFMLKEPKGKEIADVNLSILEILKENDSELIESKFPHYLIDHELEAEVGRTKFFAYRWTDLEEAHVMNVRPPKNKEVEFNPDEFKRTLYSHKKLDRNGVNYYALFSDMVMGKNPEIQLDRTGGSGDPANSPGGWSRSESFTSEAELTPNMKSDPVTYYDTVWAGWFLSKKGLFEIFDEIEEKFDFSLALKTKDHTPLIQREEFRHMKWMQLYRIRASLVVYEDGMKRLVSKLFPKGGELALYKDLVQYWGEKRTRLACQKHRHLKRSDWKVPLYFDAKHRGRHVRSKDFPGYLGEDVNGEQLYYRCVLPWMREILDLRREYAKDTKERVKWHSRYLQLLNKYFPFQKIAKWIGLENLFFQVQVSGFKTNDEVGDKEYLSDVIGKISFEKGKSPFNEITQSTNISAHEIFARYLSEEF